LNAIGKPIINKTKKEINKDNSAKIIHSF